MGLLVFNSLSKFIRYSGVAIVRIPLWLLGPLTSKYHGNYDGGLAEHSLNVWRLFKEKNERFKLGLCDETAILHDFCKINFYNKQACWRKNDSNRWESYEGYKVQDDFHVGHGEKFVIMIQNFIRLTKDPELKFAAGTGNEVTKFTLAVNRPQFDKSKLQEADFINCVCFGKRAEAIANYASSQTSTVNQSKQ